MIILVSADNIQCNVMTPMDIPRGTLIHSYAILQFIKERKLYRAHSENTISLLKMFTTRTSVLVVASALIAIFNFSVACTQSACTVNAGWCPTSTGYDANDLTIVNSQGSVCLPGGTIPKKYVNYYI